MEGLEALGTASRVTLYLLLSCIAFLTLALTWAQIGMLRGRPFQNPDGTVDDWREQKIFYGIAWADLLIACPLSVLALVLVFLAPKWGFVLLVAVAVWMIWTNVMTTATSLRFERPRITPTWLLVFPFGIVVGLGSLIWVILHFDFVFG